MSVFSLALRRFGFVFRMALLIPLLARAQGSGLKDSYIKGNVPDQAHFREYLVRDLKEYLKPTFGEDLTVSYDLLDDSPHQVGVGLPKFYIWVTVTKPDKTVIKGAACVAASDKEEFHIDTFVKSADIAGHLESLRHHFPEGIVDKITNKMTVHQPGEADLRESNAPWSIAGTWKCSHTDWHGVMKLNADGSFQFPDGNGGHWLLSGKGSNVVLVLQWQSWEPNVLTMISPDHFYGTWKHAGRSAKLDMRRMEEGESPADADAGPTQTSEQ